MAKDLFYIPLLRAQLCNLLFSSPLVDTGVGEEDGLQNTCGLQELRVPRTSMYAMNWPIREVCTAAIRFQCESLCCTRA